MFPASSKGTNICLAFPDVCKIPGSVGETIPIPIPYPNISQASGTKDTTPTNIKIQNKPGLSKQSDIRRLSGDEAGTVSSINTYKVQFKTQSEIKLNALHKKIIGMLNRTSQHSGPSPEQFQEALTAYCVQVSALYKVELSDR